MRCSQARREIQRRSREPEGSGSTLGSLLLGCVWTSKVIQYAQQKNPNHMQKCEKKQALPRPEVLYFSHLYVRACYCDHTKLLAIGGDALTRPSSDTFRAFWISSLLTTMVWYDTNITADIPSTHWTIFRSAFYHSKQDQDT